MPIFLFPSPSPSPIGRKPLEMGWGVGHSSKEETTLSSQLFALLNYCWSFLHSFSFSLSFWAGHWHTLLMLFSTLTCWGGQGLLLTCHWVFLSSFLGQIKLLNEEPYFGKANILLSQAWLWIPKCSLDTILYSFLFEMHFNLLCTQQKDRNEFVPRCV